MSINQRVRSGALALLALVAAGRAPAQSSERYSLQGFGGWAFGDTNNDNRFGYVASDEGEWNNYYFALNVAAKPMDKLSIRAQAFWGEDLRGKRIELDYAFAQVPQLGLDARPLAGRDALAQLDAQHRHLRTEGPDAHERGAAHIGMRVEHGLHLLGAQRRALGHHAL